MPNILQKPLKKLMGLVFNVRPSKIILILIIVGLVFSFVNFAKAAGLVPCGGCETYNEEGECTVKEPSCQLCHFFVMFKRIIDFLIIPSEGNLFPIVLLVAVLMLVIGGLFYFFSGGSPAKLETGRKILTSVVLGLVIIYASWVFINFFFQIIGIASWTGLVDNPKTEEIEGWWRINCP